MRAPGRRGRDPPPLLCTRQFIVRHDPTIPCVQSEQGPATALPSMATAAIMAMLAGVAIAVWLGREPLLRGVASLWIVSDSVTHTDAIVVLGGNFQVRPLVAADLYQRGLANRILVSQTIHMQQGPVTVSPTDAELNRAALPGQHFIVS
jgi:hypothetical protein